MSTAVSSTAVETHCVHSVTKSCHSVVHKVIVPSRSHKVLLLGTTIYLSVVHSGVISRVPLGDRNDGDVARRHVSRF